MHKALWYKRQGLRFFQKQKGLAATLRPSCCVWCRGPQGMGPMWLHLVNLSRTGPVAQGHPSKHHGWTVNSSILVSHFDCYPTTLVHSSFRVGTEACCTSTEPVGNKWWGKREKCCRGAGAKLLMQQLPRRAWQLQHTYAKDRVAEKDTADSSVV